MGFEWVLKISILNDAAVVTGMIHRVREFGGKKSEEHWHFIKVYNKNEDGWKVVVFQASEAPE